MALAQKESLTLGRAPQRRGWCVGAVARKIAPMTGGALHPLQTSLLRRIRDSIGKHDLIEWAANDFESFVAQFPVTRLRDGCEAQMKDGAIYLGTLPDMVRMHARCATSHVLLTHLNENWGAFSTTVPDRTADWGDWHAQLRAAGITPDRVREYLNDPRVRAVVTPQHTVFAHRSILTLPIGLRQSAALVDHLHRTDGAKTQTLLINNSGWQHRRRINERVSANFGGRIGNTYGLDLPEYFESIARSRFVLCPSGLGWDSHRVWETLVLGSIPVVEHSPGWHSVLDDLPALAVTHFDQVTPELLDRAYPDILSRLERFDYGRLTKRWWVAKIDRMRAP